MKIKSVRVFVKNFKLNLDYYLEDGKRYRFSTGIKDTALNKKRLEREKEELAQAHYDKIRPSDAKTLFNDLALEALRSTASNRQEDTQLDYEGIFHRSLAPFFKDKTIGEIKPMHIIKWKDLTIQKGISKSRFHKHWTTLGMIFKYCYINEMIEKNPMELVDRNSKLFSKPTSRSSADKYYTQEEVMQMLEHSEGWFKALLYTMFLTGMRVGEALGLQWKCIDMENRTITIAYSVKKSKLKSTKTSTIRVVNIATPLYEILKIHYQNRLSDVYVFPSSKPSKDNQHLPYHGSNSVVRNHLKPLLKKLNIPYRTLQATRHSFASNLVLSNTPLTYIQKMLGHSKLSTTMDFYIKNGLIDSAEITPILDKMYGT